jgi:hypothetical protein
MSGLITSEYDVIDYEAGMSDEVLGQECHSCWRLLRWKFFDKNSSYKSGYEPQCSWCKKQPKLSIAEHTARLYEMNLVSEGTRRQRHPDQEEMRASNPGRAMDCSLFLQKLLHIYPSLYVRAGGIIGDLALYATSGTNRPEWSGNSFKYLGFVTLGIMREYSTHEFDEHRDILLRVKEVGWRNVLINFVKANAVTEEQCNKEFGPASGGTDSIWHKKLHNHRNSKKL